MKILTTVLIISFLLAACGGTPSTIQRVTALPDPVASVATDPVALSTVAPDTTPVKLAEKINTATPAPLNNQLASGSALQIAQATDTVMKPTPRNVLTFGESPVSLTFDELYDGYNLRTGLILSDKLLSLDGQRVTMEGYMAPPLKPQLDYFVLTRVRLAFCPFCTSGSDWPDDIALVYLPDQTTTATQSPVRIQGTIEVGASVDVETGMVSLVRIYADTFEVIN